MPKKITLEQQLMLEALTGKQYTRRGQLRKNRRLPSQTRRSGLDLCITHNGASFSLKALDEYNTRHNQSGYMEYADIDGTWKVQL